jgi:hypothetical protein
MFSTYNDVLEKKTIFSPSSLVEELLEERKRGKPEEKRLEP